MVIFYENLKVELIAKLEHEYTDLYKKNVRTLKYSAKIFLGFLTNPLYKWNQMINL